MNGDSPQWLPPLGCLAFGNLGITSEDTVEQTVEKRGIALVGQSTTDLGARFQP
jgi:hypothetical protein